MTLTPCPAKIVGLTGGAGTGKSTAALHLLRSHGRAYQLSFARPLKRMLVALLSDALPSGWPHKATELLDDPVLKEQTLPFLGGLTPRYMMQTLGTEWGRTALGHDFWVLLAEQKLDRFLGAKYHANSAGLNLQVVFTDVRFPNEATMIRRRGGVVVRIVRPSMVKPDAVSRHASEQFDFESDYTLVNDGTLDDMYAQLDALWPPQPGQEATKAARAAREARGPLRIARANKG